MCRFFVSFFFFQTKHRIRNFYLSRGLRNVYKRQVAQLSEESKKHGMVENMEQKPEYGMTLGMQNILSAKRILLLVYGTGKDDAIAMLQRKMITPRFPVTFLWLHPHVDCLMVGNIT